MHPWTLLRLSRMEEWWGAPVGSRGKVGRLGGARAGQAVPAGGPGGRAAAVGRQGGVRTRVPTGGRGRISGARGVEPEKGSAARGEMVGRGGAAASRVGPAATARGNGLKLLGGLRDDARGARLLMRRRTAPLLVPWLTWCRLTATAPCRSPDSLVGCDSAWRKLPYVVCVVSLAPQVAWFCACGRL